MTSRSAPEHSSRKDKGMTLQVFMFRVSSRFDHSWKDVHVVSWSKDRARQWLRQCYKMVDWKILSVTEYKLKEGSIFS
jgi:hypothetical protein